MSPLRLTHRTWHDRHASLTASLRAGIHPKGTGPKFYGISGNLFQEKTKVVFH